MVKNKFKANVIIVIPAYNAEKTLAKTINDIPHSLNANIIVVDDYSTDATATIAEKCAIKTIRHMQNVGYGGNQKTCYKEALKLNPDIIVMLHPDYQYDARLTTELIRPILEDRYDVMFGSRIRTRQEALNGGMPLVKYLLNRIFTPVENMVFGVNFSEHMSGFRAYSKRVLDTIPFTTLSNDFIFDQQFMASAISYGFKVGEIPVPVRYYSDSSSINFFKGTKYLFETCVLLVKFILHQKKLLRCAFLGL